MSGFFDDRLFVHTHIEKTAGSTLVRGFSRAFGENRVYDLRPGKLTKPEFLPESDKDSIYLLTGHFHYGAHDPFFDRAKLYVACVRPPFDRFRSYYNYVKVRPNHPGYPSMAGKSFGQVVDEVLKSRDPRVNVMTRALTGRRDVAYDDIIAHLEQNYLLVCPHSRVNEALNALVRISGGRVGRQDLYANKGNSEAPEDIGELEARFDLANASDTMVYQYVNERYDAWLKHLDARLQAKAVSSPISSRKAASAGTEAAPTPVSEGEPTLGLAAWVEQNGSVPLTWHATTAAAPDPNLRDAFSPIIVSAIAGLPVQHRNFNDGSARLVGAGTIGQSQRGGSVHFWGTAMSAAAISEKNNTYVRPAGTTFNVHAVRGPFSADVLRRQGVEVPDVYGEPLMLLPKIMPNAEVPKRWRLGVVVDMPELQENLAGAAPDQSLLRYVIPQSLHSSVCIINSYTARSVQALFDKVDEIRGCERIASLTPLGLIIAEAFRIPCAWFAKYSCGNATAKLHDRQARIDPRVRDFYAGLGRQELSFYGNAPAQSTRWEDLMRAIDDSWAPIDSTLRPLFDAFPLSKAVAFDDERWPLQPEVLNAISL